MVATDATVAGISARGIVEFCLGKKITVPSLLFCDNKSAVMLSEGNTSSRRMRHIATRIAFLREAVRDGHVLLTHVGTVGQVADIFTKPLTAATFHTLRALLVG